MNVEYINPFLKSVKNVVETMAFTKVAVGTPGLKQGNLSWGVVSGIIGLASGKMKGNMVLSFDEAAILGIVSAMLGETFPEINKDVVDAVGELTNMISGGAKAELSTMGFVFDMAIPVVITGKQVEITQLSKGPTLSVPFETDKGKFVLEANLADN